MKIDYSQYERTPLMKLNRFEHKVREGILFRINDEFYLDYHPWCEFGDISTDEMLYYLQDKQELPVFLQQDLDLEIRKNSINKTSFKNHFFGHGDHLNHEMKSIVKLKFINDINQIILDINNSIKLGFFIRVDFNNGLDPESCLKIWRNISKKEAIDYFEDPYEFQIDGWLPLKNEGVPLASDRNPYDKTICTYKIVKANRDIITQGIDKKKSIFSSYMGHELGMYHCYLNLMENGSLSLIHGIYTPQLYKEQREIFYKNKSNIMFDENAVKTMYDELRERTWINLI